MLKNYLKVAFRSFSKDLRFSLINLVGFSFGIFSFLVIILYINHESSFDSFHEKADRVFRMGWDMDSPDGESHLSVTTAGPAPDMYEKFPEIESFCRFSNNYFGYLNFKEQDYEIRMLYYADSGFFDLFSYRLLQGDPDHCLEAPFQLVITEQLSKKIFGNEDPVGKVLKWNNEFDFTVSGVIEDPPSNSHIQYAALASFSTLYSLDNIYLDWDGGVGYFSYFLFTKNTHPENLGKGLEQFHFDNINYKYEPGGWKITPYFEALKDIHLHSTGQGSIGRRGNPQNNRVFFIIAIFILVLACVNFMNLSTARYSIRSKEIGVRKVFGASRPNLIRQFLGESVMLVLFSTVLALILLEVFLPYIRELSGSEIKVYTHINIWILAGLPVLIFIIGLLAGSYPALFLSSFNPVTIIYSRLSPGKGSISFRNILVLFQFSVSIAIIICTLIVMSQMRYIMNKNLGFDKDNLLVLPMTSSTFKTKQAVIQQELQKVPGVISTAASGFIPGFSNTAEGYIPEGQENSIMFNRISIDHNYIQTLGLEIVKGRAFSKDFPTDSSAIIVNESLARKLNWEDPVGKYLERGGKLNIIGVVKNFNYSNLHSPVEPLILNLIPYGGFNYILVKFKTDDFGDLLKILESTWRSVDPYEPFDYQFTDEYLKLAYVSETKFGQIFMIFAALSTLLAALGLFGLAAFEAEKRRKEIGIRKILGSSVSDIATLLVYSFLRWVLLSNLIAWPVSYFLMQSWLNHFSFRVSMNPLVFIAATIVSILISVLTVWSRSYRIANMNPADSIKYE